MSDRRTADTRSEPSGRTGARELLIATLAGALLLSAPLVNFLRFQDYPLARPEVGIVAFGILALAALIALAHRRQPPRTQAVIEGLLVFLAVDLGTEGWGYALLAGAAVAAIAYFRRRSLLPVLGVAALFATTAGLLGIGQERESAPRAAPAASAPASAGGPPALLHLILDEHIGIEGLSDENPRTRAMRDALSSFYVSRGFRLYGGAYSQHLRTVNAIPQILNFGATQPSPPQPRQGIRLAANAYFSLLEAQGYRLRVHQSEFVELCHDRRVDSCTPYSSSSLRQVPGSPLSTGDKARLITVRFALLSQAADAIGNGYLLLASWLGRAGVPMPQHDLLLRGRTSTINALDEFDVLTSDLRRARPGEAYVAHLLVPHFPYATAPDCRLRGVDRWMIQRSRAPRPAVEAAYFDQLRCTMARVDAALQALAASPAGRNHVVILHGDHGSRITGVEPVVEQLGRFGASDLAAGFSTLFAVRAPQVAAGYESAPLAVPHLLSQLARSRFSRLPEPGAAPRPMVMLDDRDWIPRRRFPLPPF